MCSYIPESKWKYQYLRERTEKYRKYIQSAEWQEKRTQALIEADFKCQCCGMVTDLQVHHLDYSCLENERPKDLIVLCRDCHEWIEQRKKKWKSKCITYDNPSRGTQLFWIEERRKEVKNVAKE